VLRVGAWAGGTPARIETSKPSDPRLPGPQIQQVIVKTEKALAEIDRKTGLSWRNAGLFQGLRRGADYERSEGLQRAGSWGGPY